jgi:hypothetical protein
MKRGRKFIFIKLKSYHPMTSQFGLGPKNEHFGKTHFEDQNKDSQIF